MNNLLARILLLVAGVLIGVGGFVGIKMMLQDDTTTIPRDRTETAQGEEQRSNTVDSADTNESDGVVAIPSRVDQLDFPKRTFDRKASIVSWVATLSDDELLSWLEQSADPSWQVSPGNRTELQTSLLQKFASTAPDRAIDFALAREEQQQVNSMVSTVLQVWANKDIDGAVARVKGMNEQTTNYFVRPLLTARDDLPLERMREIAIELGDEKSAFAIYFQNLTKGEIENPKDTWYEIVNMAIRESVQDTTGYVLSNVAIAWVEESGMDVLDEIVSSVWSDSEYVPIVPQILRGVSTHDPEAVFDYAMSNLGDQATEVIQNIGITSIWAQKDPQGMIAKAETLPASRFRQSFVRNAVWRWADNNPRQLLEHLEVIPPGELERASSRAIDRLTDSSPTEAAEYVMQVEDEQLRMQLAQSFIQSWASTDMDAAKEWVLSLPVADPMRASLVGPLTRSIAQNDPMGAFEFALQQPIEEEEFPGGLVSIAPEVSILRTIALRDIDLAIEMLPQVRTEGRASACTTLGSMLLIRGDSEQALGLVEHIPEDEQNGYYQMLAIAWPEQDRQGLLKAFDDFPKSAQSKVALFITMSNEESKAFSGEEIEKFESHISEDDKKLLERLKEVDMNNPSQEDMELFMKLYSP